MNPMPHKDPIAKAAYYREYRERNKAKLVEMARQWRADNVEVLAVKKKADYRNNMDAYKARAKASRERRADEIKALHRTPEFKQAKNAARRTRYANDEAYRQSVLAEQRAMRLLDGGKINAVRRVRNAKKPFWMKRYERALNKAYYNGAAIIDRIALRSYYKQIFTQPAATCEYCRGMFPIREIVLDHKQPYALGGCHAVPNLQVSCHPCNRAKHTTPYEKWVAIPERNT